MSGKKSQLSDEQINAIIRMAWEDRTTFDQIYKKTGLSESEVIGIMRRELKPKSFRLWRKRVTGRITKHRKLLKQHIQSGREPLDFFSDGRSAQNPEVI